MLPLADVLCAVQSFVVDIKKRQRDVFALGFLIGAPAVNEERKSRNSNGAQCEPNKGVR